MAAKGLPMTSDINSTDATRRDMPDHAAEIPAVSVIMNCYNCSKYLRESIDSVYAQTFTNWEIIFWDDASTDDSAEIAHSYDNKLRYFDSKVKVSLGEARNLAIDKARGKYIAFLDCDDTWLPEKLEQQVRLMDTRPEVDFIYGNYYIFNSDNNTRSLNYKKPQAEGYIFNRLLYSYSIGILTVMVRKKVLDALDTGFDPFLSLAEDYEMFMRILFYYQATYIHDPLASYRVHSNMGSFKYRDNWIPEYHHINKIFRKLDKNNKYSRGIAYREKHVVMTEALIRMAQGNLKTARSVIRPLRYADYRCFIIYLLSFLPVSVWFFLRPVWQRTVVIR